MLFQGQEFGASSPFLYFVDASGELAEAIRKGRFKFLAQFPSLATEEMQRQLPNPSDPGTFARCKLNFLERKTNQQHYDLHCDLIQLRRNDSRFSEPRQGGVDGAVLGNSAFLLRFFGPNCDDRLLIVNLAEALPLVAPAEPLLAPPDGFQWETLWSSESPRYGGLGTAQTASDERWMLPAEAAVALYPVRRTSPRKKPVRRQ